MRFTMVRLTPARPMRRSLAIGGAVDMRRTDRTEGLFSSVPIVIDRKSSVSASAAFTRSVERARLFRKAAGAADKNHVL